MLLIDAKIPLIYMVLMIVPNVMLQRDTPQVQLPATQQGGCLLQE